MYENGHSKGCGCQSPRDWGRRPEHSHGRHDEGDFFLVSSAGEDEACQAVAEDTMRYRMKGGR